MRKIAVEQLQQLQRATINDNDVINNDVTSASQVGGERRCAVAGDDSDHLQATSEPPQ